MPLNFYTKEFSKVESIFSKEKPKEKIYILFRIICFIGFCFSLYLYLAKNNSTALYLVFLSIILYILISVLDAKHSRYLKLLSGSLGFLRQEIDYLNNKVDLLDEGKEYINPEHEYAYDLDVFGRKSIFQAINRTITEEGKDTLAMWMKQSKVRKEIIKERQDGVQELSQKVNWRIKYQAIGKFGALSAKRLLEISKDLEKSSQGKLPTIIYYGAYFISALGFVILTGVFLDYFSGQMFATIFMLQLIIAYSFIGRLNKIASTLASIERNLSLYVDVLKHLNELEVSSVYLKRLHSQLSTSSILLKGFRELKAITDVLDRRANLIGSILMNGFFMNDIHVIRRYQKWVDQYSAIFPEGIIALSEFDALCSLANFRFNHPDFVFPSVDKSIIKAESLAHPLIPASRRVANNFTIEKVHQFFIVTGANMAGKSTFLRTVGINMILAGCGAPVCAKEFSYTPVPIFSSMRTADNLADDTSFFRAELNRLQKLLDCVKQNELTFIILDEILKGTNSVDKLNGSRLFLKRLLTMPVSGIIATHDLALSELEREHPGHFSNICFEISDGETIIYTYKLLPGVTQKLNATQLIEEMLLKW